MEIKGIVSCNGSLLCVCVVQACIVTLFQLTVVELVVLGMQQALRSSSNPLSQSIHAKVIHISSKHITAPPLTATRMLVYKNRTVTTMIYSLVI